MIDTTVVMIVTAVMIDIAIGTTDIRTRGNRVTAMV